jgi:uncharacterized membrane protein
MDGGLSLFTMITLFSGDSVNVVESRDPDMQALWRLISQQVLILTPTPLETAFLLGLFTFHFSVRIFDHCDLFYQELLLMADFQVSRLARRFYTFML